MKKRKLIDVPLEDIAVLSTYALVTHNIKFKAFAEKLLKEKARKVRRKVK